MPEAGKYLLSNVSFTKNEKPYISLQNAETFYELAPLAATLTLQFDISQRFCIGWRDISNGARFTCPDKVQLESKFEQCPACQKRTGFNPAFYHAASVSAQQEAYNQKPHFLYLAHFGKGVMKVGLSYAARGNSRLLEQGARSSLILGTFPSADIARQYEARIAALPGVVETVQLRKKIEYLGASYDPIAAKAELITLRNRIEQELAVRFDRNEVAALDSFYFPVDTPKIAEAHDCSEQHKISGQTTGMLGSLLFCSQQDTLLLLPLKRYMGYRVTLGYNETRLELPARQTSLF